MVAHYDGNAVLRGLYDIVSAAGDQAAANKRHIGQPVKGRKLANRIHQQYPTDNRTAAPQRATPESDSKLFEQFGHLAEPLGVARRQNHHGAGMTGEYVRESLQQQRFFVIDSASTNNHRT